MGVDYYFRNKTQNVFNTKVISGKDIFITNLHHLDGDGGEVSGLFELFEFVIKINGWNRSDRIQAEPSDMEYPEFAYQNGIVSSFSVNKDC